MYHPQAVGGIAGENVRVDAQGRFKFGQLQGMLEAMKLQAMPQHVQGAPLVQLIPQAGEQGFPGQFAMVFD